MYLPLLSGDEQATACLEFDPAILPNIDQFPLVASSPPLPLPFPETVLSFAWLGELGFLMIPALAVLACIFLKNQAGVTRPGRHRMVNLRVGSQTAPLVRACWISLPLLALLVPFHAIQTWRVASELEAAGEAHHKRSFSVAGQHLDRAERVASMTPLFFAPLLGYQPALSRPAFALLRQVNGIHAMHVALDLKEPESIDMAINLLGETSQFQMDQATQAALAGWSVLAIQALQEKRTDHALSLAEKANRLDQQNVITTTNLCWARFHHAAAEISMGRPEAATPLLGKIDATGCGFNKGHRVLLRTYHARTIAGQYLAAEKPDPKAAVATLDKAYAYSARFAHPYAYITCDLVGALDAYALVLMAKKEGAEAVVLLDRSDALLPARTFIAELRPFALLMWGYQQIQNNELHAALTTLERAYDETNGQHRAVVDALVSAHQALGSKALAAGNVDEAISRLGNALGLKPRDRHLQDQLAQAHMLRGEQYLKQGRLDQAKKHYNQASTTSPRHAADAERVVGSLAQGVRRIREINNAPKWIQAPDVVGLVPKDTNGNGRFDTFAFYESNKTMPIAFGSYRSGGDIHLTDDNSRVIALLRNQGSAGTYNERTDYDGNSAQQMLIDLDRDDLPDLRRFFRDREIMDQPLSGKIRMIMQSGVIGDDSDPLNEPDAYVKLFKNGYSQGRTNTARDTFYPIWNEGVVIDYRLGDRIKLEVWDEDFFFDDFIDDYTISEYPSSGIYKFRRRKAAVQVQVKPSTLPEGHRVTLNTPFARENIFRDHPTSVPQVADIIAGVGSAREAIKVRQDVAIWVGTNVLIPRIFPTKSVLGGIVRDLIAEKILEAAMNR